MKKICAAERVAKTLHAHVSEPRAQWLSLEQGQLTVTSRVQHHYFFSYRQMLSLWLLRRCVQTLQKLPFAPL
jgi:hypothetical protein